MRRGLFLAFFISSLLLPSQAEAAFTRGDAAVLIYEHAGSICQEYLPVFCDIEKDDVQTEAICWLYQQEITQGVGADCFAPQRTISMGEFTLFVQRYCKQLGMQVPWDGWDERTLTRAEALSYIESLFATY